jgi:hypothetical protein
MRRCHLLGWCGVVCIAVVPLGGHWLVPFIKQFEYDHRPSVRARRAERVAAAAALGTRAQLNFSSSGFTGFCTRGEYVLPSSLMQYAHIMARASRSGKITVAIVGGSTSEGGGCNSGCTAKPRVHASCGNCYHQWLRAWFASKGITMQLINGGKGSTGPDFAYLCLDSLWAPRGGEAPTVRSRTIDLVIVEFAINAGGNCGKISFDMERLLGRIRGQAPSAQTLFLNTFACHPQCSRGQTALNASNMDLGHTEGCFHALARREGLASLSWRWAILPMLQDPAPGAVDRLRDLFESPMWHHPNVEGHRHLAGMVACLLNHAVNRAVRTGVAHAAHASPGRPSNHTASIVATSHHRRLDAIRPPPSTHSLRLSPPTKTTHSPQLHPTCKLVGQPPLVPDANGSTSHGWAFGHSRHLLVASEPNASLVVPFSCPSAKCSLVVALTQSYQPLGLLDLYVDARLVAARVSAADLTWARRREPRNTVQRLHTAAKGLSKGNHTLRVVARGETLKKVEELHLPTNYSRHEVHVRSIIVIPEPLELTKAVLS